MTAVPAKFKFLVESKGKAGAAYRHTIENKTHLTPAQQVEVSFLFLRLQDIPAPVAIHKVEDNHTRTN
jgi:hypothetical protein